MAEAPENAGGPVVTALDIKPQQSASRSPRMYYLDWLRVFLLVFVAFNHTVMLGVLETGGLPGADLGNQLHHGELPGVYGGVHVPAPDAITYTVGRYLASASLAYNMGMFYLRAGYFSVPSYNRKGPVKFLLDRAIRLGVPLLVWEVLLYPLVLYIGSAGKDLPDKSVYHLYFTSYRLVGHLQMWFVTVLFALDILYVAVRLLHAAVQKSTICKSSSQLTLPVINVSDIKPCTITPLDAGPVLITAGSSSSTGQQLDVSFKAPTVSTNHQSTQEPFSTCCMLIFIALIVLVLSASMFVPLIFVGMEWNTLGITLQYSMVGQYAICHFLGAYVYKPRAFNRLPTRFGYWCLGASVSMYSVAYFAVALFRTSGSDVCHGLLTAPIQPWLPNKDANCRSSAQILSSPSTSWLLFDSFITQVWAVLFSIGLLVVFRQHLNTKPGKFGQLIINASYAFYILFPLVLVSLTKAFESVPLHPFAFVAIAWPLTVVGGYMVGAAVRALPGAGRIL